MYNSVIKYKCCLRLNLHLARPYYKKVHSWINHFANLKIEYPEKCARESIMAHNSHLKDQKQHKTGSYINVSPKF